MAVPHWSFSDIKIKDYVIPKDTLILHSIYLTNHDPKYFKDPDTFNPERFLNNEGKFVNDERVVPFGVGKRFCLGKSLAEKEYYLFFVTLLQNFRFNRVPGTTLPGYGAKDVPVMGPVRNVPKFLVNIEIR